MEVLFSEGATTNGKIVFIEIVCVDGWWYAFLIEIAFVFLVPSL